VSPRHLPIQAETRPLGWARIGKETLLYVANPNNVVTGFHIDSDGGLSPVMFPSPTGAPGFWLSLTVFPSKAVEGEGDEKGDDGHEGNFRFEAEHECEARGEMDFERDTGEKMHGSMDSVSVTTVLSSTTPQLFWAMRRSLG
jgi:hypothetical protein